MDSQGERDFWERHLTTLSLGALQLKATDKFGGRLLFIFIRELIKKSIFVRRIAKLIKVCFFLIFLQKKGNFYEKSS